MCLPACLGEGEDGYPKGGFVSLEYCPLLSTVDLGLP